MPTTINFLNLLLLIVSASVLAAPAENKTGDKNSKSEFGKSLKQCENSYSIKCLKMNLVSYVDGMNEIEDYSIIPGLSLVKEANGDGIKNTEIVTEIAKEYPNNPDARLDAFVMKKIENYFNTHSLKFNIWNAQETQALEETGRKKDGGLGGGKKGGGLGIILAMAAMMKGTLMAFGMATLAAIAGKALMTALISLVLSAVIGLKSLTSGGHKSTTYEVVAKPIYTHANVHSSSSHDEGHYGGHSSYGRSLDLTVPIALQPGYKPSPY